MPRTSFYGHRKIEVSIQPNIGLDAITRQSVVNILNLLLADETVLSVKTHRAEANAAPDLQPLYNAQYQQINTIYNEIVERVQILGASPTSDSEAIIDKARLDGTPVVDQGGLTVLADHEAFIRFLREDAQKCSEAYEDQGTFTLLVDILRAHEKMAWILRSKIAPGKINFEK
jgi:starvation-inducible DNA-binding protein